MTIPAVTVTWATNSDGTVQASWTAETPFDEYTVVLDGATTLVKGTSTGKLPGNVAHSITVTPSAADATAASATFTPSSGGGTFKAPLSGLLDRKGVKPAYTWMQGGVLNTTWAALQSSPNGPLNTGVIDQAIATGKPFKLRLEPDGGGAPAFAKSVAGFSPVTVSGAQGQSCTVGPFWRADYIALWESFVHALGAKYDTTPTLREIIMGGMGLCYSEPMLRYSTSALQAAGLTVALDEAAFAAMLGIFKAACPTTLLDLTCNPAPLEGLAWTLSFMTEARTQLGKQCVLGNNSLRAPVASLGTQYAAMYAAQQKLGPPIYYQTATPSRVGDMATCLASAVGYGANSVELPSGYQTNYPEAVLQAAQAKLIGNPV